VQRVVRNVLAVRGFLQLGKGATIKRVMLNGASGLARACAKALRLLLEGDMCALLWAKLRELPPGSDKEI